MLLVLVFHSWNASGKPSYRWKILGAKGDLANLFAVFFTGVQLFFILSGFLLAQPWFRSDYFGKPRPSLKKYARLRWFRIAPAYYCALGFWVLLFIPLITPAPLFYSARGVLVFLLHLFLLENFLPIAAQYNATWWTIPVEALFYVVLPFGVCLFYRWRWLVTLPASLLVSIGWVLLSLHPPSAITSASVVLINQLPSYIFSFALGIVLANLFVRSRQGVRRDRAIFTFCFVAGVMVVLMSMNKYGHDLMKGKFVYLSSVSGFVSFGFALLLAGLLFGPRYLRAPFNLVPLRLLGFDWLLGLPLAYPGDRDRIETALSRTDATGPAFPDSVLPVPRVHNPHRRVFLSYCGEAFPRQE